METLELIPAAEKEVCSDLRAALDLIDLGTWESEAKRFFRWEDGSWFENTAKGVIPVSRSFILETLGSRISGFTDDEQSDLRFPVMMARIRERLWLTGLSLEGTELWAEDCYEAGLDPLPELRSRLEGLCDVREGYPYSRPGKATLICIRRGAKTYLREVWLADAAENWEVLSAAA